MTITDILIIAGLLVYIAMGFRDGFFKKIFGILGFLVGLVVATKLLSPAGEMVQGWLDFSRETSLVIAFCIIFLSISVVLNLFYRWFGTSGSDTLKMWSRFGGAIIGAGQGAVAISLILFLLNIFGELSEETKRDSSLYQPMIEVAPVVFDYTVTWIPESKDFLQTLEENFKQLHHSR